MLPAAKVLPSGENATLLIFTVRPLRVSSSWLVTISHNFIALSELPVASLLPSGENTTEVSNPLCPSMAANSRPVARSHNFTVPSSVPEAKVLPSGENAIDFALTVCGLSVLNSRPVVISQILTAHCPVGFPCLLATSECIVASLLPSGENTTDVSIPSCSLSVSNSRPVATSHNLTAPTSLTTA